MPKVQIQVIDISTYHCIELHAATLVVNPVVFKFCLVNRTNNMTDVKVIQFHFRITEKQIKKSYQQAFTFNDFYTFALDYRGSILSATSRRVLKMHKIESLTPSQV